MTSPAAMHHDASDTPMARTVRAAPGDPARTEPASRRGVVVLGDGTPAVLCEPSPGREVAVVPPRAMPRHGIVRMVRQADGRYLAVLEHWSRHVRLTPSTAEGLGLRGLGWRTLRRLHGAGFIAGCQPAPATILIDLASLAAHIEATREPGFWTEERKAAYRTTYVC